MCGISFELHPNADGTWDVVVHDVNADTDKLNKLQNTDLDNAFAFIRATVGDYAVGSGSIPAKGV